MKMITTQLNTVYNYLIDTILHKWDMKGAEYDWVWDRIGWILSINDEYYVNADDLVLIHENDISWDSFSERHEKRMDKDFTANLYHYCVLGKNN